MMTDKSPELAVARWFNAPAPLTLEALRGKVIVLHAFQMLCPGCVAHGTPQAEKLHRFFKGHGVAASRKREWCRFEDFPRTETAARRVGVAPARK